LECCRDNGTTFPRTEQILQRHARCIKTGQLRRLGIVEREGDVDRWIIHRMLSEDIADEVLHGVQRGERACFCVQAEETEAYLVEGSLIRGTRAGDLDRLSIRTINGSIAVTSSFELE